MKILFVPTSDWLDYQRIPTRYNHIFRHLAQQDEVHILRFRFSKKKVTDDTFIIHEINDITSNKQAFYYIINSINHYKAVKNIVRENNIDVVVNSNLLASYMANKAVNRDVATVFDLCDFFPSSAAGYYSNVNSTFGKISVMLLEQLMNNNLKSSTNVVVSSTALQQYVSQVGVKSSVIPNGVDESFFNGPFDGERIRDKYSLNNSFVVGYVGSFEFWLNLLPLFRAVRRLSHKYDIKLLLVGGKLKTNVIDTIHEQIRQLNIEKLVVWKQNFVPYREVPSWISAMDLCTIPFEFGNPTVYYSSPIKLLEYMALGKPVLSTQIPEVMRIAGDCVSFARTEDDYVREIEKCMQNPTSYIEKGKRGQQIAMQYTWQKIAHNFRYILQNTLSKENQ